MPERFQAGSAPESFASSETSETPPSGTGGSFPSVRMRRLRHHPIVRDLIRETTLARQNLILPFFVRPGRGVRQEIASMPGNYQLSVDRLVEEIGAAVDLGLQSFMLFGIPAQKDAEGSSALDDEGIVQQALRAIRAKFPDVLLITDECFCEYTDHGHCGVLERPRRPARRGQRRDAAAAGRRSASATPAPVPTWWRPAACSTAWSAPFARGSTRPGSRGCRS